MTSLLEIISVRTAGRAERINALELYKQFHWPRAVGRSVSIKVYCSTGYETDLSIHIHWDSASPEPAKSSLGIQLAGLFKHYGLVNHTVWHSAREEESEDDR
jgi:hypothetical protein